MTLFDRLEASLEADASDLLRGDDAPSQLGEPIPAAVLVAVVDRVQPTLLLTVRTETLRHHAGQVAFPGGRIDAGESAVAAALREANEEVGLDRAAARIVGCAGPYGTVSGYSITPVIAIIPPDLPLVPSDGEVATLFEAPLAFVADPANRVVRTIDLQGVRRTYFEIVWQNHRIWGATAGMIVNLSRRLELVA